jgi:hypothetical protein
MRLVSDMTSEDNDTLLERAQELLEQAWTLLARAEDTLRRGYQRLAQTSRGRRPGPPDNRLHS